MNEEEKRKHLFIASDLPTVCLSVGWFWSAQSSNGRQHLSPTSAFCAFSPEAPNMRITFSPRRSHFCACVSFRQSLRRGRCAWSAGPKMCEALSSLWQHQHYWWRCQNKRSLWHCWHHTYSQATTPDWPDHLQPLHFSLLSRNHRLALWSIVRYFQIVLKIAQEHWWALGSIVRYFSGSFEEQEH